MKAQLQNGHDADSEFARVLEVMAARNTALATTLRQIMQYVGRVGGYVSPEDGKMLAIARSLLAESERWGEL